MKTRLFLLCTALCLLATLASSAPTSSPSAPAAFKSLKELVDVLPHPIVQQFKVASKVEGAKQEANKVFMEKVVGKTATIKVHAQDWVPWSGTETSTDKMRITMTPVPMTVLGTTFKVNLWILIPQDQVPVLSKMSKGGEITVTGELTRFEVEHTPEGLRLVGDLRNGKLETR